MDPLFVDTKKHKAFIPVDETISFVVHGATVDHSSTTLEIMNQLTFNTRLIFLKLYVCSFCLVTASAAVILAGEKP